MAIVQTYGRVLPEDGDKGSSFFDNLENNIVLDDAHSHNGVNSTKLASNAFNKTTQALLAAGWQAVVGKDLYYQAVAIPAALTRTKTNGTEVAFKDTDSGHALMLSVEWVSDSSFYVYINDPSKNITVIYM